MTLFMRGEPLVAKLAAVAMYGIFPAAMIASLVYSPPDWARSGNNTTTDKSPK